MSRAAANCILLLTAMIWGSAFVAQATAMSKLGPILFTALRFLIAAAAVLPFAVREGSGRLMPAHRTEGGGNHGWRSAMTALCAVFVLGQLTQQFGIMGTSVTNAGFITTLYVLMVPVIGVAVFRRWPHPIIWPAATAALAGTWLLGGGLDGMRAGDLLILVSALFWALQVVLIGEIVQRTGRPLFAVFTQSLVGGAAALLLALSLEPFTWSGILVAFPELFVAGALSGGLAFSLQAIGQRYTGAADAAVVFSSEAVFAALAAALVLGERLAPAGWLGCGLILAGVLAVQLVPARAKALLAEEGAIT